MTTLADIKSLTNDRRRDTTANSIDMTTQGHRAFNTTLQIWNAIHDWPWTEEIQAINYHDRITTYSLNSDFKAPIKLRPGRGTNIKDYALVGAGSFDSNLVELRRFAVDSSEQVSRLRVKSDDGWSGVLTTAGSLTSDGSWVISGSGVNLSYDSYDYYDEAASISFGISGGATVVLTNSTISARDFSRYVDRGAVYFNLKLPTITNLTSVQIKFGTSASHYYVETLTTDYLGDALAVGWNKLKADFGTVVGTPTVTSITYVQVTITYGGSTTASGFRIENFFVAEDTPLDFRYYSTNMVYDVSAGLKVPTFNDAAATTDRPLWSGQWDNVTPFFVDSVLETLFWMTGEYDDMAIAQKKIVELTEPIRSKYPSRRRHPELRMTLENY